MFKKFKHVISYDRLINDFLIIGLLFGLVCQLMDSYSLASMAWVNDSDIYDLIVKPQGYRELKVLSLTSLIGAGFFALFSTELKYIPKGLVLSLFVMITWMTGHAIITFSGGFRLSELVGTKGPGVWWTMLLLFAGMSHRRWRALMPCLVFITAVGAIDGLYRIEMLGGGFGREQAGRTLRYAVFLLLWTAPLIAWVYWERPFKRILSLFPLGILSVMSFLTATRSWLLFSALYLIFAMKISFHYKRSLSNKVGVILIIFIALLSLGAIVYVTCNEQLVSGFYILSDRVDDDTRSWQLEQFFTNVPVKDLILGTGPRGTWKMGNKYYGYVDGAYFFLLFLGGIPLLLSYFYVVIYPALKCLKKFKKSLMGTGDGACVLLVLFWALALTGLSIFTAPDTSLPHMIVVLCAGRCWGLLRSKPARPFEETTGGM